MASSLNETPGLIVSILRNFWIVVILGLVGVAAGLGFSRSQETQYTATVRISLAETETVTAFSDRAIRADRRLLNEAQRLESRLVFEETEADTGIAWREIRERITVEGTSEIDLVVVRTLGPTPAEAAGLANAHLDAYERVTTAAFAGASEDVIAQLIVYRADLVARQGIVEADLAALRVNAEAEGRVDGLIDETTTPNQVRSIVNGLVNDQPSFSSLRSEQNQLTSKVVQADTRIAEIQADTVIRGSGVLLAERASEPSNPSQPTTGRNTALGGVVGVLLGSALAWRRQEVLASRLLPEDPAEILETPLIAEVPRDPVIRDAMLPNDHESDFSAAIQNAVSGITSLGAEVVGPESLGVVLVLSSALAGEGRSTIAINLTQAIAADGHGVVVVDASPRSASSLTERSNVGTALGLFDYGSATDVLSEVSHRIRIKGGHVVDFVPRGQATANPASWFRSVAFVQLIEKLRATYGLVLIDGPSLDDSGQVVSISGIADGMIVVVSPRCDDAALVRARRRFDLCRTTLIGYVFNSPGRRSVLPWRRAKSRIDAKRRENLGEDPPPAEQHEPLGGVGESGENGSSLVGPVGDRIESR